jgi:DNA-binding transcriptional LysR family regulator
MFDLDLLLRFAVVAEELSFTRAANRLHVDQPWLSRQIQRLEAQIGFPLLIRSTRSVKLTSEGRALLAQVAELAEVADRTQSTIRDMVRAYNSLITFGANPATYWIPERKEIIERFEARSKNNSVELTSNYTPRLLSKLRKHLIDVALIQEPFDAKDLECLVIHEARPGLLVPPDDSLASRKSVRMSDLAGKQIATASPKLGPEIHRHKFGPFFEAGALPVIVPEGDTAMTYYAVAQKLALVVLSWPNCDLVPPPNFVYVPIEPPVHTVRFAIVRRQEPQRSLMNRFWEVAQEVSERATRNSELMAH